MATQLGDKYNDDVDDLLNELDDELDSKPAKGRTVTVNSGWGDSDDDDSAKQGRRAKKAPEPDPEPVDDGAAEEMAVSSTMNNDDLSDGPPKPARRKGGWGEESAAGRRRGMDQEDERLRPRSADKSDDDDNEIPTIPDLEDAQDEDMTMQVAMAPNVAVNRVATYRELDNELLRHAAFLTLDNEIDLKILAKGLSAEADVQEIDAPWDWDRLFTEVSSELLTEWEKKEAPEEDVAA